MKRLVAWLLCFVLLLMPALPTASAQETGPVAAGQYAILDLTVSKPECTATVRLNASEACVLIVGAFEEDGRLIASGITGVSGDDGDQAVQVPLSGSMPSHFLVRAFLVDGNSVPLCPVFKSYRYASFMDKTAEDFPGQSVVYFGEDEDQNENYAVLASGVVELRQGVDFSAVTAEETEETVLYTLSDAEDSVRALTTGQPVLLYEEDESIHAAVVGSVAFSDGKAVITAEADEESSLGTFFDYVTIDMTLEELGDEALETEDGVTLLSMEEEEAALMAIEPDNVLQSSFMFQLNREITTGLSIKGKLEVAVRTHFTFAYAKDDAGIEHYSQYSQTEVVSELDVELVGKISNQVGGREFELPLAKVPIGPPLLGAYASISIPLTVELDGSVGVEGSIRSVGTVSGTDGSAPQSADPGSYADIEVDVEAEVNALVAVRVKIAWEPILKLVVFEVAGQCGVEITARDDTTMVEILPGVRHLCSVCFKGEAVPCAKWWIKIYGQIGKLKYTVGEYMPHEWRQEGIAFYFSPSLVPAFGLGVCPNRGYLNGFLVEDAETGEFLTGAKIWLTPKGVGKPVSGLCGMEEYVAVGTYQLMADCEGYHLYLQDITISSAKEHIIKLISEESEAPNPPEDPEGPETPDLPAEPAPSVSYEGTYYGTPYIMYSDGTLLLKGNEGGLFSSISYPWYGDEAFKAIKRVVYGEGITGTGIEAFGGAPKLTSVSLPSTVELINDASFRGSTLTQINFPERITFVGNQAFSECANLTGTVSLPSVTEIDQLAFWKCASIEQVSIGQGTVGEAAFHGCTSLKELDLGEVTEIGYSAFSKCESLQSVSLPDELTVLGGCAFEDCKELTGITVPGGVKTLGRWTFRNCAGLENAILESGIEEIGEGVFANCESLRHLSIPDTVKSIGDSAFNSCVGLRKIIVPDSVTKLGTNAFYGCTDVTRADIGGPVTEMGLGVFQKCTALTDVTVSEAAVLGQSMFENCYDLQNISLPDTLTEIGSRAFYNCESLTELTLPASLTSIGAEVFTGCTSLETLNVNSTLAGAADGLFRNFDSLTAVNFGDTADRIGISTFEDCDGITELDLPETLKSVGENGFRNCDSLKELTIPAATESLGAYSFFDCSGLEHVAVLGCGSMERGVFQNCTSLTYAALGNIPMVGDSMFDGCASLKEITIPGSAKRIGQCAFLNCSSLETAALESGVETLASYSFQDCKNLSEITIPASVTSIAPSAFWGCDGLSDVYYQGSQAQWEQISIGSDNHWLTNATIHFAN